MWKQDVSDDIVHVQGTMAIDKWGYFSTKALTALPLLFLPCECQVALPVLSDSVFSHTFKCSFSIFYSIRSQPPPETLQYPERCVGPDPELGQSVTRTQPYERVLCILTNRLHSYAYTRSSLALFIWRTELILIAKVIDALQFYQVVFMQLCLKLCCDNCYLETFFRRFIVSTCSRLWKF